MIDLKLFEFLLMSVLHANTLRIVDGNKAGSVVRRAGHRFKALFSFFFLFVLKGLVKALSGMPMILLRPMTVATAKVCPHIVT